MGVRILQGDSLEVLRTLESESVNCCVTSPPYWGLRDYGCSGQIGLESTPGEYIARLMGVFDEVWRVLADDGTVWVVLGDCYAHDGKKGEKEPSGRHSYLDEASRVPVRRETRVTGLPAKNLVGLPWLLALGLQARGWILREDVIWHKPNGMPDSVRDRCVRSHEYVFHLSKRGSYYHDWKAIGERCLVGDKRSPYNRGKTRIHQAGKMSDRPRQSRVAGDLRNRRSVWTIATEPYPEAHFATFPRKLVEPCILASSRVGGVVLDPFGGSGTVGEVAARLGRSAILIELNAEYVGLAKERVERGAKCA